MGNSPAVLKYIADISSGGDTREDILAAAAAGDESALTRASIYGQLLITGDGHRLLMGEVYQLLANAAEARRQS